MTKLIKRRSKKAGLSPGSLIHVGKKKTEKVRITILDYDEEQFQTKEVKRVEECFPFKKKSTVTWINIDGLHDIEVIEKIGKDFGIHSLVLEDILNTTQRLKIEDFDDYIFIVLNMISYSDETNEIHYEQVALILGVNFVITFQEKEGDVFNTVRKRIKNGTGRIRKRGADYLAYALIDAVVDHYYTILEKIGEEIEALEDKTITSPSQDVLVDIHRLKKEMILLRRIIWPIREIVNELKKGGSDLIKENMDIYLADVYDHTIQVIETIEIFKDALTGIHDSYMSSISNKMNEVMKVLTIIATIFIPLTFIAGIYGMNFKYMPELEWHWGYFSILIVMFIICIGMVVYFKKKRWL
ncbi:MAG: magnesium/cobalt transporter CorA [Thermodesulfobacteriota bacterium]|nr:magnesium/cobalt transporter CorA [Thermodesulfobacteriota bacterium]